MTIKELHQDLIAAYSSGNLNNISLTLINLFKNGQYSALQKISEMISEFVNIPVSDEGKGFHKLMMLYHPDRAGYHINEINQLKEQNNFDGLVKYSHILKLERIGELTSAFDCYEDIDYNPVYEWDTSSYGYNITDDFTGDRHIDPDAVFTFYDAMRLSESGDPDDELTLAYLESAVDIDLSSANISDLDGVQYCRHVMTLDLSNNHISDLQPLSCLPNLEELNLSDNEIGMIDDLVFLRELRSVNLSYNYIDDITPLLELGNLEYADLTGNSISPDQLNELMDLGVIIDF